MFKKDLNHILSFKSAPALNLITFFAAIVISSPVRGLRPLRSPRSVTEKEPKPTSETRSPLLSAPAVASMNASRARFASAFEMPAPSAIASTNSALFMVSCLWLESNEFKYIGGIPCHRSDSQEFRLKCG